MSGKCSGQRIIVPRARMDHKNTWRAPVSVNVGNQIFTPELARLTTRDENVPAPARGRGADDIIICRRRDREVSQAARNAVAPKCKAIVLKK